MLSGVTLSFRAKTVSDTTWNIVYPGILKHFSLACSNCFCFHYLLFSTVLRKPNEKRISVNMIIRVRWIHYVLFIYTTASYSISSKWNICIVIIYQVVRVYSIIYYYVVYNRLKPVINRKNNDFRLTPNSLNYISKQY